MINAVSNKIRLLKHIQPDQNWLQSQRDILLIEISKPGKESRASRQLTRQAWKELPAFLFSRQILKPVLISWMILALLYGGGVGAVQIVKNSLSGDLFYPVKIVLENVRMKLSSQEAQSKLQAEFVGNRVDELTQIIDNTADPVKKAEQVVKTVDKLQAQIVSTKVSLDKIKEAQPEKAAEVVQKITEKTVEAKEKIAEEFSAQGGPASGWKEEELKEVTRVLDAMDKALAVIIGEDKSRVEVQAEKVELEKPLEVDDEPIITFPSIPLPVNEASESFEDTL